MPTRKAERSFNNPSSSPGTSTITVHATKYARVCVCAMRSKNANKDILYLHNTTALGKSSRLGKATEELREKRCEGGNHASRTKQQTGNKQTNEQTKLNKSHNSSSRPQSCCCCCCCRKPDALKADQSNQSPENTRIARIIDSTMIITYRLNVLFFSRICCRGTGVRKARAHRQTTGSVGLDPPSEEHWSKMNFTGYFRRNGLPKRTHPSAQQSVHTFKRTCTKPFFEVSDKKRIRRNCRNQPPTDKQDTSPRKRDETVPGPGRQGARPPSTRNGPALLV